ncbi:MAG: hypothetical protein V1776_05210 [Candidatus Diapherotrites archaeon]
MSPRGPAPFRRRKSKAARYQSSAHSVARTIREYRVKIAGLSRDLDVRQRAIIRLRRELNENPPDSKILLEQLSRDCIEFARIQEKIETLTALIRKMSS